MSFEGGRRREREKDSRAQLYMNRDGTHWFRGPDGNVVVLDDAGDAERDRQQQNPDGEPAAGYPKFSIRARRAEIPAEGTRAPEEGEDASRDEAVTGQSDGNADRPAPEAAPSQPREEKRERRPRREREAPAEPELSDAEQRRLAREYRDRKLERERLEREQQANEQTPAPDASTVPPDEPPAPERQPRPHMDHDVEASQLAFREKLLRTLDPNGYQMHQNAEYTGREGELERYYTFAGLPLSMRFTQEEIEWVRGGFQGEPPLRREPPQREPQPVPREEASPRPRVGSILNEAASRQTDRSDDQWNIHIEAFKGMKPKTIEQLINDPKDNIGFSRLVESLDRRGIDIIRRTVDRTLPDAERRLTKEETRLLNYARYEFTRRLQQVEYVNSKLSLQDLELFARRDPDLEALIGFRGPERTLEVFKREIYTMAMTDRDRFDELVHTYEKLSDLRGGDEYQRWERGIRKLCEARGVSLDDYEKAYRVNTPEERAETTRAIRAEVRGKMSPFRQLLDNFDFITDSSSRSTARRRVGSARGFNTMTTMRGGEIEQVDKALDTLTGVLRVTIVDDPYVSFAVQQEAVQGKNIPLAAESGPTTFKGAQEGAETTSADIDRMLGEHMRTTRKNDPEYPNDKRQWDYLWPEERRESLSKMRQDYERDYAQKASKGGSNWFARALSVMWLTIFHQKMEKVINMETKS